MEKFTSKEARRIKTHNVKQKRFKKAQQMIQSYCNSDFVLSIGDNIYHNIRGIVRNLKGHAISNIIKSKYKKDYIKRHTKNNIGINKRARHKKKIDLHQIAMNYEDMDNKND